jgi:Mce-associated membrane protein
VTAAEETVGIRGRWARLRAAVPRRAAALSAGARRGVLLGLVAALVAGVVAAVLLGQSVHRDATARATAEAVLTAAGTDTEKLLSIAPDNVDADLALARTFVTEPFATQFERTATEVIAPATRQHHLLTTTKVSRAALISCGPDRAEVLVYITQYSSTGEQPLAKPTIIGSQARETLVKVGDRWLISEFQVL